VTLRAEQIEALPSPLRVERSALPRHVRAEIEQLIGTAPVRFSFQLLVTWVTIGVAVWWAAHAGSVLVSLLVVFVVASRQMLLGFLLHEQVHDLAYRGWWGDLVVNLLAGWPLMVITVEGYAQVHLSHHKYYFTAKDPDFVRKSGADWAMPTSPLHLSRLLLTDLLGLNLWKLIQGKRMMRPVPEFARWAPPLATRLLYYLILAAVITAMGAWTIVLLYWVLPLLTVTQALLRWGALCEHKYNLAGPSVAQSSPIIVLRWWDRLVLPNLNFTLHPYHHYWPGIPYGSLSRVHQIFEREGLVDDARVFHGYWCFLKFVLGSRPPGS
jgi:fatty acid desaturase